MVKRIVLERDGDLWRYEMEGHPDGIVGGFLLGSEADALHCLYLMFLPPDECQAAIKACEQREAERAGKLAVGAATRAPL